MDMIPELTLGLFGRVDQLESDVSSHTSATTGIHGATDAATASKLLIRDGNARAKVADPPASDSTQLIATTAWVQGELAGLGSGTVTSVGTGTGLTGGPITSSGTIDLADTAVAPGTYTYSTLTVDQQGRLTAASSGTQPLTSLSGSSPIGVSGTGSSRTISISAATPSAAGSMSASDKSKLDNITSGAEPNAVDSVFGRTGAVTAQSGDYTVQKISGITVSTGSPSGGANGDLWFKV